MAKVLNEEDKTGDEENVGLNYQILILPKLCLLFWFTGSQNHGFARDDFIKKLWWWSYFQVSFFIDTILVHQNLCYGMPKNDEVFNVKFLNTDFALKMPKWVPKIPK